MKEKVKVGWATKWISNRKYLNEVSVEGKVSSNYYKHLGHYDSYQNEVIRSGNCLTLLSTPFSIRAGSFWKLHFLEDYLRFVFFTFNKSFVLDLIHQIPQLKPFELTRAIHLFQEYFEAFSINLSIENDEELEWCMVKNDHLKNDPHFHKMYSLDKANRQSLLTALLTYAHPTLPAPSENLDKTQPEPPVSFIDMLNAQVGLTEIDILNRIKENLQKAGFEYDIFQNIEKGEGGRNLYGLNPRIGIMVDFFSERNYFLPKYNREEIFHSYMHYTGNTIGKFNVFLSEYRKTKVYKELYGNLKALSINKLK